MSGVSFTEEDLDFVAVALADLLVAVADRAFAESGPAPSFPARLVGRHRRPSVAGL